MSTAFASDPGWEPDVGLRPSPARAFLHALAAKLHRVADGIVHGFRTITTRIGQFARTIASGAASVLSLALSRGGLRASIGLLVTGGQVVAYALREGAGRLTASIAISRKWGPQHPVVDEDLSFTLGEDERERLLAGLFVVLGTDGTVHVHGIPGSLDVKLRNRIAQVAAHAAEQRLEMLVKRGRPLTPLDLKAINAAARSALVQHLERTNLAA